jgi:hypothetical protein
MSFNEDTNNLIIINYNPGSGGKFLSGCLALSDKVLHLQEIYAKSKYIKKWKKDQSFKASMSLLKLSEKHGVHIEYEHGNNIYGFSYEDNYPSQLSKANNFFKELTNQNEYLFFLTNHFQSKNFLHFKNAKNIIIINDEKLINIRKNPFKILKINAAEKAKEFLNCFLFDISTIENDIFFLSEIERLSKWLKIEIQDKKLISILREHFMKNLILPVISLKDRNWNQKDYYKGSFKKE